MTGLKWEDPPERVLSRARKTPYTDIAAALKENPGQWALMPGERTRAAASTMSTNVRRGKMKDFSPEGHFEALFDEQGQVWLRYVGASPDPETELDGPAEEANGAVRTWARANGFPDLPDRGRLPQEVRDAYARRTDG